ncbi:MAG: hypothetical protein IJH63_10000 [Methanobrevibacter sp.]|nr:hypothetical protein [Methanosphaera sp.]MBR0371030.1 hypothetical protein [Methanobrevibacter sp.]
MFWKNKYQPTIIGCELSDEELQQFLNEIGVGFQIIDNPTRWAAYAQYHARENGFDIIRATSFAYMCSLFFGGMGISAGTEMYIKEEQIKYAIIDALNNIKSIKDMSEEKKVKMTFEFIFNLYSVDISQYEYATERLSLRITPSEMKKFQSLEGKTNKDKFKSLLNMI